MSPRRLVRLFPRIWRERYGLEFEALLESSPLTRWVVMDVVRRAAAEWFARTVIGRIVLGTGLFGIATGLGQFLAVISPDSLQHRNWPAGMSMVFGMVQVGIACRFLWCVLTRTRTPDREQALWITALFASSVAAQWGVRVAFGSQSTATLVMLPAMWVMMVQNCMETLAMSRILPRGQEPRRLHKRPAVRPIGLQ